MAEIIDRHKPSVFIQFAGQGVKYIEDLKRLYHSDQQTKAFIICAVAEIKRQAALYDDSHTRFFFLGLDVEKWLIDPDSAPGEGYLLSSPVSHPLIFLTQISNYLAFLNLGLDQNRFLKHVHSATGFSTGVVAAILVSMNLPYDQLVKKAVQVTAMFFWQGIRTQESMFNIGAEPFIDDELLNTHEGSKCCMASVNKITKSRLDMAIDLFSDSAKIYPAYELLPWRWIIAGLPEDIECFKEYLKINDEKTVFRYIPSTIAAHSPFLFHALKTSPLDAARLGVNFKSEEMEIPVWSNDTGSDLRESSDIIQDIMDAYFVKPGHWRSQIAPIKPPTEIAYVLDFGPGTGVASLTENHIVNTGVKVIRCSIPFGRKEFAEKIFPSLD